MSCSTGSASCRRAYRKLVVRKKRRRPADVHGRRLRPPAAWRVEKRRVVTEPFRTAPRARPGASLDDEGGPSRSVARVASAACSLGGHCPGGIKKGRSRNAHAPSGWTRSSCSSRGPAAPWRFPPSTTPADLEAFPRPARGARNRARSSSHANLPDQSPSPARRTTLYEQSVHHAQFDRGHGLRDRGRRGSSSTSARHLGSGLRGGDTSGSSPPSGRRSERCNDNDPGSAWRTPPAAGGNDRPASLEELSAIYQAGRPPPSGSAYAWIRANLFGLRLRHHQAGRAWTSCSGSSSTARIGLERPAPACTLNDLGRKPLGSNRDRHENIGDGLIGDKLAVFLGHPPSCRDCRGCSRLPGDGHGPDAEQMQKLRALHKKATK